MSKKRVSYFMDHDVGGYYYGKDHPMKPHRIAMTHNLVLAYGLYRKMEIYRPRQASPEELKEFHAADYVSFLQRINPDTAPQHLAQLTKFNLNLRPDLDCPVFDGLFEYCQTSVGGSIDGARKLMAGTSDIAINWAGGMHHAKKGQASGFCYTNDIVLGIIEMLRFYPRVLYVDIDVHHGDGVEEAFYVTDRVMTVSFHKYGNDFFPMTGDIWDIGAGRGRYYAVNCPLMDGITDARYEQLFKTVITKVMEMFRPSVVVLQCGADSLCNDRIGTLNLTLEGHAACVQITGILLDRKLDDTIPYNDYWEYFAPEHKLHFPPKKMVDMNSKDYLEKMVEKIMENLRCLDAAPSVQMHTVPSGISYFSDDNNDNLDPDMREENGRRKADNEFYD
ncbi:histone deacetylase [Chondrus crispus]|uniref:Histone deacetylase n=1 Tax=Chondrus crispus TaxID=2769 RepID=R7QD25_CHOCR|nr:histone deacetylase [Chondrus crispus]CDF35964.1 histone deacetylase [Chondrus crispus]|eukprot:XP_005715783.1 histone deacetylase [Chondrus crispus]